jgi:hypothetical protein
MGDNDPDVARIAALEATMPCVHQKIDAIHADVMAIRTKLDQATGGMRVLMILGGLGGLTGIYHLAAPWLGVHR